MKTRIIFFVTLFFISVFAKAQEVEWSSEVKKKGDNSYTITINAVVDDGWYIYGIGDHDNIAATKIDFDLNQNASLDGQIEAEAVYDEEVFDEVKMVDERHLGEEVTFTQTIKAKTVKAITINIHYMTCNGERCMPPKEIELTAKIKK